MPKIDPTTAAIEEANAERDRLRRAEANAELLSTTMTEVQDRHFAYGYTRAVREIRDHFEKVGPPEAVAEIEKVFHETLALGKVRAT